MYGAGDQEVKIMEEDWDNLILLDACRYDDFKKENYIKGHLSSKISLGSATPEFLNKNFEESTHHDTVYVTANPMYRVEDLEGVFYHVIDVWESDWDDEKNTVPPEPMVEKTINAYQDFPDKRILAHFMQPHCPFIGEHSDEIGEHAGYERTYRQAKKKEGYQDDEKIWDLLEDGKVSVERARNAYIGNLRLALENIEKLLDVFDEKTVITSDHGNLFGEPVGVFGKSMYGHPTYTYSDELRRVPWLVVSGDTRKTLQSKKPDTMAEDHEQLVNERLSDLGYT